jgi:hypothetical protein
MNNTTNSFGNQQNLTRNNASYVADDASENGSMSDYWDSEQKLIFGFFIPLSVIPWFGVIGNIMSLIVFCKYKHKTVICFLSCSAWLYVTVFY